MTKPSVSKKVLSVALVFAFSLLLIPHATLAHDLTLGVHYTTEEDKTDTVYVSDDGETFYGVSQPYVDTNPYTEPSIAYASNSGLHCCHMDPSITYWNGYFWMMSADQHFDGKFWPIISYSKDLIHWTHPEEDALLSKDSNRGVELDVLPVVDGRPYHNFDVVTPKFAVINNELYITFCAGYFGLFHGNQFHDQISCYVMKVTDLSADDPTDWDLDHLWPKHQRFVAEEAHLVTATSYDHADYIDSNFVVGDDGSVYLAVKQGGLTEQLFKTTNPDNPADGSAYELYNPRVSWGYEGVSINKANGLWHLYGDGVVGTKPRGMREITSESLERTDSWVDGQSTEEDAFHDITFLDPEGRPITAMHGQEITITPDSPAYSIVKNLLAQKHAITWQD